MNISVVVPEFAFLASIISAFAIAQLFASGIVGESLARTHFRIIGRPAYAIRGHGFASTDGVDQT